MSYLMNYSNFNVNISFSNIKECEMDSNQIQWLISMVVYMGAVIGIGIYFMKKSAKSSENFFLGGRSLGPWVAAMSAEASDMSGWLLMGLPGVAYWCGIADAAWTAIGLAIGTYINWLVVAKRLRNYSEVAANAITLPEFFSNRFKEKNKVILTISATFILIFFTVYASSCFVTCGKLFSTLFNQDYKLMMILGAVFVVIYTFLGGFLAESVRDFMQAIVMIVALSVTLIVGVISAGGIGNVIENAKNIPGFFSFFTQANPTGPNTFGEPSSYGFITILSTLAWGLGYFGMPQVLLRFMAIRKQGELKRSRIIATVWVVISLFVAVFIGVVGRALFADAFASKGEAENIFILISTNLFPPLIAGVVMAGILAATISSSDSYILIAASAFAKNIFGGIVKKDASDKQIMFVSRIVIVVIALIGILIALDENSIIFKIVSFAWAGFGATFGPLMLFSLFYKRTTRAGAIAGMITGGSMVFIWNLVINPLLGQFAIYELLPAFILSSIVILVVSLLTKEPSKEIQDEFEQVKLLSKKKLTD